MKNKIILDTVEEIIKAFRPVRTTDDTFPYLGNRKLVFSPSGNVGLLEISEPHINIEIDDVTIHDLFCAMAEQLDIHIELAGRKISIT